MKLGNLLVGVVSISFVSYSYAKDLPDARAETVNCYQNGTSILRTQDRIREFSASNGLKIVADVGLVQASETHQVVYANDTGVLVCVVTVTK